MRTFGLNQRPSLPPRPAGVTMPDVMTRRFALAAITVATLSGLVSCDHMAHDPGKHVVAEVGGEPVTVAELQAYLDATLVTDPAADPLPPRDLARVKSRLFDDYLDGEILVHEARRREIKVSDAELADYRGSDAPPSPAAKEVARRDLVIQKLRESVVLSEVHVDDAKVDAWLAAHPAHSDSELAGRLRTLRFASYPEAMRVRNQIVSKKLTLEQAESAYGADAVADADQETDLAAFPDHIAAAVKALAPGRVSQPLPFESSVLLFLLSAPEEPSAAEARRREQAERAVALEESQEVAASLLEGLRKSTSVVRHTDQLPFPYVAEAAAPNAK